MSNYDLFRDVSELKAYLFRITDNGGESLDRYSIVFTDGTGLTHGVSSFTAFLDADDNVLEDVNELENEVKNGNEVDLALGDLPENVATHVMRLLNESFKTNIELIEKRNPLHVAPSREQATINEGGHDTIGCGIYWSNGENAYRIRRDIDFNEDSGPYKTARDVLYATLPDINDLSGPEYHSTVDDLMRMEPSEDVAEKIKELENRVDSGNDFSV